MKFKSRTILLLVAVLYSLASTGMSYGKLSFLHTDGNKIVDAEGKQVVLKGCNLGNWLMLEPWMFGGSIQGRDQTEVLTAITDRFGEEKTAQLMEVFRENWMGPRDFKLIKSFGFNVVRLPIDYGVIQSDAPPYAIKPDAFKWIDKALDWAEAADVYVIIDLHGAPGRQSTDGCTGASGMNQLWGSETNLDRTVKIWQAIAERYKDRSVIAAYDLLNEPYGDFRSDNSKNILGLVERLYTAIRAIDDKHIMFAPGVLGGGTDFYGDPHARGWTNFGFTEHHYAGLFGDKPAFSSHDRTLNQTFPAIAARLEKLGVPYLVGEYNVVLSAAGGDPVMREYLDRMSGYGWASTMWSYKLVSMPGRVTPNTWCMVTNLKPLPHVNLREASYEDLENLFIAIGKDPLEVNEPLRTALTDSNHKPITFAKLPELPIAPPADSTEPEGFTAMDIGGAAPGGQTIEPDGTIAMYAGGLDIWGKHDSFRFLSQPITNGQGEMTAQVVSLLESNQWAKAGIMARWGEEADAPLAMINVFPDGAIAVLVRTAKDQIATETKILGRGPLPAQLRLSVNNGKATGSYRTEDGSWKTLATVDVPTDPKFRIGLATCSHNNANLTVAKFRLGEQKFESSIGKGTKLKNAWTLDEAIKDGNTIAFDFNGSANEATAYQDINVEPGKRYTFAVRVNRKTIDGWGMIDLKLENVGDAHPVTLNIASFGTGDLGDTNEQPAWLAVTATPLGNKMRCTVVVTPSKDGFKGTVEMSDATISDQ